MTPAEDPKADLDLIVTITRPDTIKARDGNVSDKSPENIKAEIQDLNDRTQAAGAGITRMKPIMDFLHDLAEIHPISRAAWISVSSIWRMVEGQYKKDQAIVDLYETMIQAYQVATAKESESLNQGGQFSDLFKKMVRQTEECHIFLSRYVYQRRISQVIDQQALIEVQKFKRAFNDLKQALDDTVAKFTLASVLEVRHGMSMIEIDSRLQRLKPSRRPPTPETSCSPGTRLESLLYLRKWAFEGEESVMWLSGIAGSGKSSLMGTLYTTARNMGHTSRLGAYIRFDRAEYTDPSVFVRELACQLAEFDERLGQAVAKALQQSPRVPVELLTQFKEYIVDPLQSVPEMHDEGPIFVLIDALDECDRDNAKREFRAQLLKLLRAKDLLKLLPFLRILIASRPDDDIRVAFDGREHVLQHTLDPSSPETKRDIAHFLRVKLADERFSALDQKKKSQAVERLSERASGLFVAEDVEARLDTFLGVKAAKDIPHALEILYQTALDALVDEDGVDIKEQIKTVLGLILAANQRSFFWESKYPITIEILNGLVQSSGVGVTLGSPDNCSPKHFNVQSVVRKLGSVLIDDGARGLRLMHQSFDDFLMWDDPGNPWFVDVDEHIGNMAYATISYALARLEDSNYQVADTSPDFEYAMYYWPMYFHLLGPEKVYPTWALYNPLWKLFSTCLLRWMHALRSIFQASSSLETLIGSAIGFKELVADCNIQSEYDPDGNLKSLLDHARHVARTPRRPSAESVFKMDKVFESVCQNHAKYQSDDQYHGRHVMLYEVDNVYVWVFVEMADHSNKYEEILDVLRKRCPLPPVVSLHPDSSKVKICASEQLDKLRSKRTMDLNELSTSSELGIPRLANSRQK
ncbi:nacht and wd40 domain protein [Moniliophthora roreri]|nr:nacht and wd40 domain protein [Moniliophthora roreri]